MVVHVITEQDQAEKLRIDWEIWQQQIGVAENAHLFLIHSPYRLLIQPLLSYIDDIHKKSQECVLSILLPEFIVEHWWEHFLHNQTALRLKAALWLRPGIIVVNLPHHLSSRSDKYSVPGQSQNSESRISMIKEK